MYALSGRTKRAQLRALTMSVGRSYVDELNNTVDSVEVEIKKKKKQSSIETLK